MISNATDAQGEHLHACLSRHEGQEAEETSKYRQWKPDPRALVFVRCVMMPHLQHFALRLLWRQLSTLDPLKNAYRRLVAKHHPDRNPGDTLSNQKMQLILQAYEILRNKPAYNGGLNRHSLLEDDHLVKSILPEGVEPEPLGQPYEEWHRKQFYEGYFY